MSRMLTLALLGTTTLGLTAASFTGAEAGPFPAMNAAQVGGPNVVIDHVRYRGGGYHGGRRSGGGYGYRRNAAGAAFAGAALGLISGAIAASAAPRYGYGGYYDNGYYGAGYSGSPAYGYGESGYGYGYAPVHGGYGGDYHSVYGGNGGGYHSVYGGYGYGDPGYGW